MIADVVAEVVVRGLFQAPGYAVLRMLRHRDPEFRRDGLAIVVGVFFWVAVALAGSGIYLLLERTAI